MSTRKIAPAPTPATTPVLITATEAGAAAAAYRTAKAKEAKLKQAHADKVAKLEAKYQEEVTPLAQQCQEAHDRLSIYAEQQRSTWAGKSVNLGHCTIGYRSTPAAAVPCAPVSWDDVKDNLLNHYPGLVNTKTEVNKKALSAALASDGGHQLAEFLQVELVTDEKFFVTAN